MQKVRQSAVQLRWAITLLGPLLLFSQMAYAQTRIIPKIKFCQNPMISGWQLPDPKKVSPGKAFQSHMCRASVHLNWLNERVDDPKHARRSAAKLRRIQTLLKALYSIKPHSINKMAKEAHNAAMLGYQSCMDDILDWLHRCERAVKQKRFKKARFYIEHIRVKEHQCHLGYAFPKY